MYFWDENICILIHLSLLYVAQYPIDEKHALAKAYVD